MSIATYIKEDLETHLLAGNALPTPLTYESLAEHYDVSFTPVRAAIAELIKKGLLEKGANRRISPKRLPASRRTPADASAAIPLAHEPSPYEAITNEVVRLSLDGESVHLREEATAHQFKISRSAVRAIFNRLTGEGMLDHLPRRGWRVRPFRQEDMQAFLEVREALELKALELAKPHLDDADLQRLLDGNFLPKTREQQPRIDNSLHVYLIEKAGNAYILDFFQRQGKYYDVLFVWEDQDRPTAIETVRQHREILEAILAKDWSTAAAALSHHIRCNHPILSTIVAKKIADAENSTPTG